MPPINDAAWILAPKGELKVATAPYNLPEPDEIVIKNEAFAIQPFDVDVRDRTYIDVPYPFIPGNSVAGIVEEVGPSVTRFKKGDRAVSDTPAYQLKQSKYGGWQKYVISKEATTAAIPATTTFEEAAAILFPLLTAVAALQLELGMDNPGTNRSGKALIYSASGSVGGYAVQYAASIGYDVVATASPRKFDYVRALGAAKVLDYSDDQIVSQLKHLGPFDFVITASGDVKGANIISEVLQPAGGAFVSTRPKTAEMNLAPNVSLIYDLFGMATQKPENAGFTKWWYHEYLPVALAGAVTPTFFERRRGLAGIQQACTDVLEGRSRKKIILNPQN